LSPFSCNFYSCPCVYLIEAIMSPAGGQSEA
jgi:hypothetical protein